jgi:hypothetical protein
MTRERLGPPLQIRDLEITPVERISIRRRRVGDSTLFEASKRPVAIVVRSRGRTWRIEVPEAGSSALEIVHRTRSSSSGSA